MNVYFTAFIIALGVTYLVTPSVKRLAVRWINGDNNRVLPFNVEKTSLSIVKFYIVPSDFAV